MAEETKGFQGFQGSETSRAEVTIYSHGDEPGLFQLGDKFTLHGPFATGGAPTLVRVETNKSLGVAAGTFSFDVKADRAGLSIVGSVSDDDWVDIVFTRWGVKTHVMRGQIDDIRRATVVDASGATTDVLRISGRDFGRIFELTPIWFDIITDGALGAGATARVLESNAAFFADPATTTESLLAGFLSEVQGIGRANWELPPSLPSLIAEADGTATFAKNICFFDTDFVNHPERSNAIDFSIFPGENQSIWEFAMAWADLPICEVYTDLLATFTEGAPVIADTGKPQPSFSVPRDTVDYSTPQNDPIEPVNLDPDLSVMSVVFRDRPFPTLTRVKDDGVTPEPISEGPWFTRLKVYEVTPQHVTFRDVGRSGAERKNAFYAAPRLVHELTGGYFDYNGPLWNPDDMKRHGFRRDDTTFNYVSGAGGDLLKLSQIYRQRMRDFHCMNHLFLHGSIMLGHGRPDIRIGHKLRILGATEDENETYYIETVKNAWALAGGVRTTVGVTRGWVGSDLLLIETFNEIVSAYRRPEVHTGVDEAQPEENGPPPPDGKDDLSNAERYAPNSTAAITLFTKAAFDAFIDAGWADPTTAEGLALHELLRRESGGYVGRPNFTYGTRARKYSQWQAIWAELKSGQLNQTGTSSATGLGQLLLANTDVYYPSGRGGIGVASEEAIGMLAYIKDRYGTPSAALAFHTANHYY